MQLLHFDIYYVLLFANSCLISYSELMHKMYNMFITREVLVICSSPVAYKFSLYVYIHEVFIILSCYLNCGLT